MGTRQSCGRITRAVVAFTAAALLHAVLAAGVVVAASGGGDFPVLLVR